MTDALSRRSVLLTILNMKLVGFEFLKSLYADESNFKSIYKTCEVVAFGKYFRQDGYLFMNNHLCVPFYLVRELLV